MAPKSVLVMASLVGLAAVTGVTAAVMQSPTPIVTVSESPIPIAKRTPASTSQAPVRSVPQSTTVKPNPEPAVEEPQNPEEALRKVESCRVTMARVADPDSPLNVRSTPDTASRDNIVGQLKNGTFVTVRGEQEGWFQISTPLKGWVSMKNTDSGCNEKLERVSFGKNGASAEIRDRFVGTGSHQYRFNLAQGQTLSVTSNKGPLPAIITPTGKLLSKFQSENKKWIGELPATGDYSLEMESNYKGYQYSFVVEVK